MQIDKIPPTKEKSESHYECVFSNSEMAAILSAVTMTLCRGDQISVKMLTQLMKDMTPDEYRETIQNMPTIPKSFEPLQILLIAIQHLNYIHKQVNEGKIPNGDYMKHIRLGENPSNN